MTVSTTGSVKLRQFLAIFRWLSILLAFVLTRFGNVKYLINPLPSSIAEIPFVLILILFIYHIFATFISLKFYNSRLYTGILIAMDVATGAMISFYFGLPFFFLAVVLPLLTSILYFDLLISMIVALVSTIFFASVIAIPLIKYMTDDIYKSLRYEHLFTQLAIFVFSVVVLYLLVRGIKEYDEEVELITKRYQDERNLLFENHEATKEEFQTVFQEIEKQKDEVGYMETAIQEACAQRDEALKTLENTQRNLDSLRKAVVEAEQKTVEIKAAMEESASRHLKQLRDEYEALLDEKKTVIDKKEQELAEKDNEILAIRRMIGNTEEKMLDELEHMQGSYEQKISLVVKDSESRVEQMRKNMAQVEQKAESFKSRISVFENLFQAYYRLSNSANLESIFVNVVDEAKSLVPSQTVIIFSKDKIEEGVILFAEAASTPYKDLFNDFKVYLGDGPVGWVAKALKPLIIKNGDIKDDKGNEISTLLTYEKSALVIPLVGKGEITAVLYFGRPERNSFSPDDAILMQTFCKMVEPMINNALAYEMATRLSMQDPVTGLYNDNYFFETYEKEMARTLRYGISMNLTLIEIENYEIFAESSEKMLQDHLIRDLSDILKKNIRETDLAARLSENQFAILFLHSKKEDAIMIAERIRMSMEMRTLGTEKAKKAGLKFLVGLTNAPKDAKNKDELFNLATKCIRDGKSKGKSAIFFNP